ncbi:potassium transporter TrkG [Mycoplasma putrefaciens]|uniref:TrkH family potassium uptake protein n=1 Tax=Mycoplasma putrefaciens TaxID=2123 RepID=UPI003DA47CC9
MVPKDHDQKETNSNQNNTSKRFKKPFFKKWKIQEKDKFFINFKNFWPLSKTSGKIFLIYLCIILLGALLLSIPNFALTPTANPRYSWDYLTGIFLASSAFSDTGLTVIDVSHSYTFTGQLILLLLIEAGGIGVLTFKVVLFLIINKKISISDTMVAQSERGSTITNSTIHLIKDGFIWLSIVQVTSAFILFFLFFFNKPGTVNSAGVQLNVVSPYHNFWKSLWFAIFHSTSAINNAGFDIISPNSLQPYNVDNHRVYAIQVIFMLEWIIGGLGYPTFHDIKRKIQARKQGQKVKFSLFTKLNFWVYLTLFILGPIGVLSTEYASYDNSLIFHSFVNGQKITKPFIISFVDILFNTTASRNAGFSTISIDNFNPGSKSVLAILMFIGSAPSSTAGGIRTTTFAILLLSTISIIKNRKYTSVFKKTIPDETVRRSYATFFISSFLIFIALFIIYIDSHQVFENIAKTGSTNNQSVTTQILVLITSAFGTVGLSPLGYDDMYKLKATTKILLVLIMFIGQLGVSNTLLIFIKPAREEALKFLDEDVTIG